MDRTALRKTLLRAKDDAYCVPLESAALGAITRAIDAAVAGVAAGIADGCLTALLEHAAEAVRGSVPDAWFEDAAFDTELWAVDAIACELEDLVPGPERC